ncbi:MAG: hypothetical protein ACKOXO_03190 [Cyanobium sp.]
MVPGSPDAADAAGCHHSDPEEVPVSSSCFIQGLQIAEYAV